MSARGVTGWGSPVAPVHIPAAGVPSPLPVLDVPATVDNTAGLGVALEQKADLDSAGRVPFHQIPLTAISDVHTVASEAEQLGLITERGDVVVRSDLNRSFMRNSGTSGTMSDWTELKTPTDAVLSVDGRTGAVDLSDRYQIKGSYQPAGNYSLVGHTHAWADITGKPATFTPSAHTHTIADVTGLQSALDGKAATGHTHSYLPLTGGMVTGSVVTTGNLRAQGVLESSGYTHVGYGMANAALYLGGVGTSNQGTIHFRTSAGDRTIQGDAYGFWLGGNTFASAFSLSGIDNVATNQPWYGLGFRDSIVRLTGYYGVNIQTAGYEFILPPSGNASLNTGLLVSGSLMGGSQVGARGGTNAIPSCYYGLYSSTGSERGWFGFGDGSGNLRAVNNTGGDFRVSTNSGGGVILGYPGTAGAENYYDAHSHYWRRTNGVELMSLSEAGKLYLPVGIQPRGIGGDSGAAHDGYSFGYQEAGPWSYPYPDLIIGYHTGVKFGANTGYGGMRFYNDHPAYSTTELMSIGNGDNHVRIANLCYFGNTSSVGLGASQAIRIGTPSGYVDIGPMNTSFCHFQTDRAQFYMNKSLAVEGAVTRYGQGAFLHHADGAKGSGRIFESATQPAGMQPGDIWLQPI